MKRYLTCYSKGTLTIRDRKTNQSKVIPHCTPEHAELVQEAIKSTNYYINTPKNSKVETINASEWLHKTQSKFKAEYGWIKPQDIKFVPPDKEELNTETVDTLNTLSKQLDELLST